MINYGFINDSISYYASNGFDRIESPWLVHDYVDSITRPIDTDPYKLVDIKKCLVASGEQSFLQLYLKGFLPRGKFQTTTPCFRRESFDFLHTNFFIKNELIITDKTSDEDLLEVTKLCLGFFKRYLPSSKIVETDAGYDIICYDTELGSYGIRECEFLRWIYATGCAEPRLSRILKLNN